jgi:hypothetical protein
MSHIVPNKILVDFGLYRANFVPSSTLDEQLIWSEPAAAWIYLAEACGQRANIEIKNI